METFENTLAVVSAPRSDFTALDADEIGLTREVKGKTYRKQLLKYGTYPHPANPSKKLVIDDEMADRLIANFNAEVADIVQVPVANDKNQHVEDPNRNIGEVVGLEKTVDGLDAIIDIRDETAAPKLGRTLLGTSAMMHLDYTDTRTGEKVGPTLLHALVTNRPYITGMRGYEEIVAASADTSDDEPVVFATREEDSRMTTKEELVAMLREDHGIDVEDLMARASADEARPDAEEFAQQVLAVVKASGVQLQTPTPDGGEAEELSVRDVAEAVIELAQERAQTQVALQELQNERAAERKIATEKEVDDLISDGYILPKQRPAMVKLAQENREMFQTLLPEQPIVDLSEEGSEVHAAPGSEHLEEEIARLSRVANGETE